jgi:2-iminobutanoate/2-iminopropanoate deaminase
MRGRTDESGDYETPTCSETEQQETVILLEQISTARGAPPLAAYSQAIRAGNTLYITGTGPIHPETGLVSGDGIEGQARQVLDNIEAILDAAGTTWAAVAKATVYLADVADFGGFNAAYAARLPDPKPARTVVGADLSHVPNMRVVMEVIAHMSET